MFDIKRGEKYNFLSRRSDKEEGIDVRTPQDSNFGHPCPRWGMKTNVDTIYVFRDFVKMIGEIRREFDISR